MNALPQSQYSLQAEDFPDLSAESNDIIRKMLASGFDFFRQTSPERYRTIGKNVKTFTQPMPNEGLVLRYNGDARKEIARVAALNALHEALPAWSNGRLGAQRARLVLPKSGPGAVTILDQVPGESFTSLYPDVAERKKAILPPLSLAEDILGRTARDALLGDLLGENTPYQDGTVTYFIGGPSEKMPIWMINDFTRKVPTGAAPKHLL